MSTKKRIVSTLLGMLFLTSAPLLYTSEQACISEQEDNVCPLCNKSFSSKALLIPHLLEEREQEPFKCPCCDDLYMTQQSLDEHMEHEHTGDGKEKFQCAHCKDYFSDKSNRNRHMEKHDGVEYLCGACGESFTRRDSVLRHQRSSLNCRTKKGEQAQRFIQSETDNAQLQPLQHRLAENHFVPNTAVLPAFVQPWPSTMPSSQFHNVPLRLSQPPQPVENLPVPPVMPPAQPLPYANAAQFAPYIPYATQPLPHANAAQLAPVIPCAPQPLPHANAVQLAPYIPYAQPLLHANAAQLAPVIPCAPQPLPHANAAQLAPVIPCAPQPLPPSRE